MTAKTRIVVSAPQQSGSQVPGTPPDLPEAAQRRLQQCFAGLIHLIALLVLLAGAMDATINLPLSPLRLARPFLLGLGTGLFLLGLVARHLPPALGLAAAAGVLVLALATAVGFRPPQRGDVSLGINPWRVWTSDTNWFERHSHPDPQHGRVGTPNAIARQHDDDFDVTYHLDDQGWRRMPVRADASARSAVWIIGCSFTFGAGVEDDETYAHLLASQAWPQAPVRSMAVSGWGTTNAYLTLQRQLQRSPPPAAVLYGWISHHSQRNHLRKSWFGRIQATATPWFEVEAGQLHWKGLAGPDRLIEADTPAQEQRETALSVALIRAMAQTAQAQGSAFVLLVLQRNQQDAVLDALKGEPGLQLLDLSQLSTAFHPLEGHPMKSWHQAIAHAIAADPLLARLTGQSALWAPEAIIDPPLRRMALSVDPKLKAASPPGVTSRVVWPLKPGQPLRVSIAPSQMADPWAIYLKGPAQALRKGAVYALDLRLRADRLRQLPYQWSRDRAPWGHLGLAGSWRLTPEWRDYHQIFEATDDATGYLSMQVASEAGAVELAHEPRLRELQGAEARQALATLGRPRWVLSPASGARARLDSPDAEGQAPWQVDIQTLPNQDPWALQVRRGGLQLAAGQAHELVLQLRAAQPRKLRLALTQDRPPWANQGLYAELDITTTAQTFTLPFTPTAAPGASQLTLALGDSPAAVELRAIRLHQGGDTIDLLQARP